MVDQPVRSAAAFSALLAGFPSCAALCENSLQVLMNWRHLCRLQEQEMELQAAAGLQ